MTVTDSCAASAGVGHSWGKMAPAVRFELTTKRLTDSGFHSQKSPFDSHRDSHRLCAGPNCLTKTRAKYCQFCIRTAQLAAAGQTKPCLRCERERPLTDFAGNGRFRVCDDCRWDHQMTDTEKREAHRLANSNWKRHRRRRELRRAA